MGGRCAAARGRGRPLAAPGTGGGGAVEEVPARPRQPRPAMGLHEAQDRARAALPGSKPMRRLLLACALALAALPAMAQDWSPTRPIRWIVGFAPGGVGDTTARIVGAKLAESLGQPVVIENRPSAGGILASETVARSAPDGHTFLLVTSTAASAPHLFRVMPYDPINDFTFVSQVASFPHIIV